MKLTKQHKNFLIRGSQGSGKTTFLAALTAPYLSHFGGFLTKPYHLCGRQTGHYFHSLVDTPLYANNLPITLRHLETGCIPVPQVFETLGLACLKESQLCSFILLDELGRIEAAVPHFIEGITQLFDSDSLVFAAIKKEEIPYLTVLLHRDDVFLLDLDCENDKKEPVLQLLKELLYEKIARATVSPPSAD